MPNDRPRRLGNGTLSHTRPHPYDGHLAPRLVGGRRRHRGTAKQLSPIVQGQIVHFPTRRNRQSPPNNSTSGTIQRRRETLIDAGLIRTFQGWQAHGILIWSRSNQALSQGAQAMLSTQGYAAMTAKAALQPFSFERREVGPQDVLITITHCGICHSDIHQARDEWGGSIFPMVPGHEIVGTITQIGSAGEEIQSRRTRRRRLLRRFLPDLCCLSGGIGAVLRSRHAPHLQRPRQRRPAYARRLLHADCRG